MRKIVVKYNNIAWAINDEGLAPAASPLDEPVCIEVHKQCNRFNVHLHYMPTSEKYVEQKSIMACVRYGVSSGRLTDFSEISGDNAILAMEMCLDEVQKHTTDSLRRAQNIKSAKSILHKILEKCNRMDK